MVTTLRISDKNHEEVVVIQAKIQMKNKKTTTMDMVLSELVDCYYKVNGGRKR